MAVVEARDLTKHYGDVLAVDGIDLDVEAGEVFGFFGPNGAGKSTTLRMLTGVTAMTAGRAQVCGIDVGAEPARVRDRLAILAEYSRPDDAMTAEGYLRFHVDMVGDDPDACADAIAASLAEVDMAEMADKAVGEMSLGQRRRTELARVLLSVEIVDPDAVLLDEPFNSVDAATRRRLRDRFLSIAGDDRAVIYTSHDLIASEEFVDRYAFIVDGRIVATGSADDLREQYLAPRVRLSVRDADGAGTVLERLDLVRSHRADDGDVDVTLQPDGDAEALVEELVAAGVTPSKVEPQGTMEDVLDALEAEGGP